MTSQPVSSIFLSSPLPSGTWRTPSLSIPWCCLPTSFSVYLVFSPLSLCLTRWFWPDLMNGKHAQTQSACVCLRWSGGFRVVRLPAGSLHRLPRWYHGLRLKCVVKYLAVAPHFHVSYSSLHLCRKGPWFTSIQEDGCDKGAHQSTDARYKEDSL